MNKYVDDNFLSGRLIIIADDATRITTGRFIIYDEAEDKIKTFTATTTCRKDTEYNENTGIEIVKLKIAKNYYSYKKRQARKKKDKLEQQLLEVDKSYIHSNKKLENIKASLSRYGLMFFN